MVRSVGAPAERAPAPRHGSLGLALGVLTAVLFLTFLDNTIVSVALGSVQADLHAGVSALQWVVSAYALTFAGAMLAFGMVGDEFGRKRVMLAGVAIFCAGSVLAALAPNIGLVIAGRAVMGFGAAASEPGTLSMLRHLYTDERARTRAIGVWAGVSGLALAVGPVIGGALVGVWNWRAIFWFNLAFGLVALVAGMIVLPENSDPDAHRVDIAGTVLGAAALTALVFAVIGGEDTGFTSAPVITLLCLSAVAAVAFFWWESRAAHPLLDLKFLRKPTFLTANVVAFCAYFATFAVFFFTALYLEEVVGDTGYQITLVFLPMTALMIAASLLAGRWTDPAGPRWSIFIGCLMFGAGLLLTTVIAQPAPRVPAAGRGPRADRGGDRCHRGADYLGSPVRGPAGPVRHGRLGYQHQPGNRGRDRRGDSRRAGQRAAAVQPDQQAQAPGHPVEFPVHRHPRRRNRRCPLEREHRGRWGRGRGRPGHPGAGGHPRGVQCFLRGTACRAPALSLPGARRRALHVRAPGPPDRRL